jgi:glycosyltransferase involved in cell wall biosynthesis
VTKARTTSRSGDGTRVLVIVQNLHVPFDRRVWLECGSLTRAGYDVTVICPRGPESAPREVIEDVTVRTYASRAWGKGGAGFVAEFTHSFLATTLLALDERRRGGPFAVVQACNPPDIFWPLARLLRMRDGSAFVFDHHDLCPELYESRFPDGARLPLRALLWLERMTLRTADRVISTNESYAAIARRRGGKRHEHVTVVRTGPDPDFLSPGPPDPSARRGHDHLAAYLGVMGPQDGVDYALRALAHLRDELGRTDLHSVFIGSGDAHEDAVALSKSLGLDDCVEFTGRISDEGVQRYLSTADICLSPDPKNPLNDVSSMNKVVEYMAMGKPIVSFDLHEARVTAHDAAVYTTDSDEQEFAELIDELLDDPKRRERMGRIGRERVESALSWEFSKQRLLEAYSSLLEKPRRRLLRRS